MVCATRCDDAPGRASRQRAGQEHRTEPGAQAPRAAVDHPPAAAAPERPGGIFRSGALLAPGCLEIP